MAQPVPKKNTLTSATLRSAFWPSVSSTVRPGVGHALLKLAAPNQGEQQVGILDAFASGRHDPRVLIAMRYLAMGLRGESLALAIRVLGHATDHPDIFWSDQNWIVHDARLAICSSFCWSGDEMLHLMAATEYDEWQRGQLGQYVFHLLAADPDVAGKSIAIIPRAFDLGDEVGAVALAVALHFAGEHARDRFNELKLTEPRVLRVGGIDALEQALALDGYLSIF
jgi:hypothetical protein